jgi:hypothetical protein
MVFHNESEEQPGTAYFLRTGGEGANEQAVDRPPDWATSHGTIWSGAVWAYVTPRYRSAIAGHVVEGPTTPVCRPNVACTRPFANATVLVLDSTNHNTVGTAVTNGRGNFLVRVSPGDYLVHMQVVDFPRCPEVQVKVRRRHVIVVHIDCDTGIR